MYNLLIKLLFSFFCSVFSGLRYRLYLCYMVHIFADIENADLAKNSINTVEEDINDGAVAAQVFGASPR